MSGRAGLLWDTPLPFCRYIEDCGVACQHVSPQLLAAPHFRGSFSAVIVPAGFGNPAYSRLLPALRASSGRIARFVEGGGNLLVYGPGRDNPGAYDWLPFGARFFHAPGPRRIEYERLDPDASLVSDFDTTSMECDGYIEVPGSTPVAFADGRPVIAVISAGKGRVVLTAIHEYPSRSFIVRFCSALCETLL